MGVLRGEAMKWQTIKLGDIADFSNGINFNKSAYSNGIKLIGASNFGNRHYPNFEELQEVKTEIVRPNDCLRDGDIVFARSNGNKELVGRCMLIKSPPTAVTFSGFCIRMRLNNTKNTVRIISHIILSPDILDRLCRVSLLEQIFKI